MTSYQNILVTLDGSELAEIALDHISKVAEPGGAIHLLSVVGSITAESRLETSDLLTSPMNSDFYNKVEVPAAPSVPMHRIANPETYRQRLEYVQTIATRLQAQGYRVLADVQQGRVVDTIVCTSQDHKDLVVMATHGRTGLSRVVLGSVAEAVLHKTSCPMLLVPARIDQGSEKPSEHAPCILVCLDGSQEAEAVLPEVEKLLSLYPAKVILLRVGHPIDIGDAMISRGPLTPGMLMADDQEREALSISAEHAIHAYLDGIAERLKAAGALPIVEVGCNNEPSKDILYFSQNYNTTLIAMATHGWAGMNRLIRGSVTETVLEHAQCPLLIVHRGKSEKLQM